MAVRIWPSWWVPSQSAERSGSAAQSHDLDAGSSARPCSCREEITSGTYTGKSVSHIRHQSNQCRSCCSTRRPISSKIKALLRKVPDSGGEFCRCMHGALRDRDPLWLRVRVGFDQTRGTILMQLVRVWMGDE